MDIDTESKPEPRKVKTDSFRPDNTHRLRAYEMPSHTCLDIDLSQSRHEGNGDRSDVEQISSKLRNARTYFLKKDVAIAFALKSTYHEVEINADTSAIDF